MPSNRLIIQWNNSYVPFNRMQVESFKTGSLTSARKIISNRRGDNMRFATYYNASGIDFPLPLPAKPKMATL